MARATTLPHYTFKERLIGATRLKSKVYDDIRDDPIAGDQALLILLLPPLLIQIVRSVDHPERGLLYILLELSTFQLLSFFFFGFAKLCLARSTSWGAPGFMRTLAFASVPGLLVVLSPLPVIGKILFSASMLWSLLASVVAARQSLGVSTPRSIAILVLPILAPSIALIPLAFLALFFQP